MFYVVVKDGEVKSKLYHDWNECYRDTFSPSEVLGFVSYIVRGKTYDQKKECVRDIAKDTQILISHAQDISREDLYEIKAWFEKMGRRFGLLKDFRENGII